MRLLDRVVLLLGAALPVSELPAQHMFFAQNDNTSYGNLAVGWPAAVMAFRFNAPASTTVTAAQVFTGNQAPAPHTLELRAHDPVTGLPGTLLGPAGTWTTLHARCWQGATLAPVALAAGQDYWLVWRVSGMFHQHSVAADSYPGNTLVETRISDGSQWHGQAQLAAKFRLFTHGAAGTAVPFGTASPGQYGDPQIGVSGWPALGNPIDVWLDNAARRQTAVLLVGTPLPAGIVFPFGTAWCSGEVALFLQTVTETSPFVGGISHTFFVPNLPAAAGFPLTFQWAVLDPAAAFGIAHTGAVLAAPL